MRRDTLALGLVLVFLLPFSVAIGMGYFIDYERGCANNSECPSKSTCVAGTCKLKAGCGKNYKPPTDGAFGTTSRVEARRRWREARRERRQAFLRWRRDRNQDNYRQYQEARQRQQQAYQAYISSIRSRRYASRYSCPYGARCDIRSGTCYYRSNQYSALIWFHPGYYHHRARMRRMARYRRAARGVRGANRYRSRRGFRGFRGGGLGFGK